MEKSQELIGILQAISIVAKSLAAKLMQIEKEVEAASTTWSRGITISTGCRCPTSRPMSAAIPTAATWRSRA